MKQSGYRLYKGAWIWQQAPQQEKKLSVQQAKTILKQGGYLVRNTFNFDCQEEKHFWFVIKDTFNGIQDVPSKYRSRVRTALETFEIRQIAKAYLLENGYEVYVNAVENYRVKVKPLTIDGFKSLLVNFDSNYGFWGCIHKETGRLAAFAINHIVENYVDYQIMKFHPEYLATLHPSYGLIYEMNRYYLNEKGMQFVCDGTRSLTNHSEFQPFLIQKFKFRKAYCHLQIIYRPWLGIVVKMLFPFRKLIKYPKVSAILRQEAWARGVEK